MEPARSIARLGFKKWYERRLIEAHAWLLTAFLCLIVIAGVFEGLSLKAHALVFLGRAGMIFVAGLISWQGLQRFLKILAEAERYASRAHCEACHKYASFTVVSESPRLTVRCRKCAHEWRFD